MIGQDIFLIYKNNNFPEIKINNFIVNLNISASYSEVFGVRIIDGKKYEISISCDDTSEYFIFDKESYTIEKTKVVNRSGKE